MLWWIKQNNIKYNIWYICLYLENCRDIHDIHIPVRLFNIFVLFFFVSSDKFQYNKVRYIRDGYLSFICLDGIKEKISLTVAK